MQGSYRSIIGPNGIQDDKDSCIIKSPPVDIFSLDSLLKLTLLLVTFVDLPDSGE